ncbi:MAG TPA: hypothetical protein VFK37_06290 [Bacillales bacterium]|nr:hypothetical protein [Bacillales bacterium]
MGMKATSFLTGALFGSLAAGSAVLLLTPQSGKEWREEWSERGREVGSMIGQVVSDSKALKNDLSTASWRSFHAVKEGTKGLKLSIDDWKKSTEPNIDELMQKIQQLNEQMDKLEENMKKQPPSNQ